MLLKFTLPLNNLTEVRKLLEGSDSALLNGRIVIQQFKFDGLASGWIRDAHPCIGQGEFIHILIENGLWRPGWAIMLIAAAEEYQYRRTHSSWHRLGRTKI